MAFKLVVFACLISVTFAGLLPHYLPPASKPAQQPEAPANYEFQYAVNEPSTGDIKEQHEKAENGVIKGQYWLIEPDGSKRIVDYTADDHHGFQATVRKEAAAGWKPEQPKPWANKPIYY